MTVKEAVLVVERFIAEHPLATVRLSILGAPVGEIREASGETPVGSHYNDGVVYESFTRGNPFSPNVFVVGHRPATSEETEAAIARIREATKHQ